MSRARALLLPVDRRLRQSPDLREEENRRRRSQVRRMGGAARGGDGAGIGALTGGTRGGRVGEGGIEARPVADLGGGARRRRDEARGDGEFVLTGLNGAALIFVLFSCFGFDGGVVRAASGHLDWKTLLLAFATDR
jgi:hypothetical protein